MNLYLFIKSLRCFKKLFVILGVHTGKGQILELAFDVPHSQPLRQRSVYLQGLFGVYFLFLGGQGEDGFHVVESVRKLDQNYS